MFSPYQKTHFSVVRVCPSATQSPSGHSITQLLAVKIVPPGMVGSVGITALVDIMHCHRLQMTLIEDTYSTIFCTDDELITINNQDFSWATSPQLIIGPIIQFIPTSTAQVSIKL